MMVTSHVLAGAALGRLLSRHPVLAFGGGVASHVAMDLLPHWGAGHGPGSQEWFLRVARRDGVAGLAAVALGAAGAPRQSRSSVLAGMFGAALLDADKPVRHFFGISPFPAVVQRFHERIQCEASHRLPHEIAAAVALAGAAWFALRRPGSASAA